MNATLQLIRIEPRLSPDPVSEPDYLLTEMDGDRIVESVRYGDGDIAQYGIDKVREWIDGDLERYQSWVRDEWSFVDLRLVAVVEVQAVGQRVGTLEIDGPALGGVESDADHEYLSSVVAELSSEFKVELSESGFGDLDAISPADIVNEP